MLQIGVVGVHIGRSHRHGWQDRILEGQVGGVGPRSLVVELQTLQSEALRVDHSRIELDAGEAGLEGCGAARTGGGAAGKRSVVTDRRNLGNDGRMRDQKDPACTPYLKLNTKG